MYAYRLEFDILQTNFMLNATISFLRGRNYDSTIRIYEDRKAGFLYVDKLLDDETFEAISTAPSVTLCELTG